MGHALEDVDLRDAVLASELHQDAARTAVVLVRDGLCLWPRTRCPTSALARSSKEDSGRQSAFGRARRPALDRASLPGSFALVEHAEDRSTVTTTTQARVGPPFGLHLGISADLLGESHLRLRDRVQRALECDEHIPHPRVDVRVTLAPGPVGVPRVERLSGLHCFCAARRVSDICPRRPTLLSGECDDHQGRGERAAAASRRRLTRRR
jgi:hypothetical protein